MTMTETTAAHALAAAISAASELARSSHGAYILPTPCQTLRKERESSEMVMLAARAEEQNSSEKAVFHVLNAAAKRAKSVSFQPILEDPLNAESPTTITFGEEDGEDAEKRLARSRERNREHARRTRLRKKAHLESLQAKVHQLEQEGKRLKQGVEECSIASILVGLATGTKKLPSENLLDASLQKGASSSKVMQALTGKRKRFLSEELSEKSSRPLKLDIEGRTTWIGGGKNHVNWKTGVYRAENGEKRQLTHGQLEALRRERNRMHAKMTRDRKKNFISAVEKTIQDLETENQSMRDALSRVSSMTGVTVTPITSPMHTSTPRLSPEPEEGSVASSQPSGWSLSDD